ncbi:MAG: polysulfide reductase, partial [Desulfobulbaceae bacterium]|nr:polysulfide reductase [Desulfobulbaceae bacterium]
MNKLIKQGFSPVTSHFKADGRTRWSVKEKIFLGLTPSEYLAQALRNPFNWILAVIYAVGVPILIGRFIFGLGWVTHSSYDYPWGLFLGWGLFTMV